MTHKEAKRLVKEIGMTQVKFSDLFGKSKNWVTDFKRWGVPLNIAIILRLWQLLAKQGVSSEKIIAIVQDEIERLRNKDN